MLHEKGVRGSREAVELAHVVLGEIGGAGLLVRLVGHGEEDDERAGELRVFFVAPAAEGDAGFAAGGGAALEIDGGEVARLLLVALARPERGDAAGIEDLPRGFYELRAEIKKRGVGGEAGGRESVSGHSFWG